MTLLPLLKPFVYDKKGRVFRVIKCPDCGKPVLRAHVGSDILGLDDPRVGNAHTHCCCHNHVARDSDRKLKELRFRFVGV